MKKMNRKIVGIGMILMLAWGTISFAHYGMIISSDSMVMQGEDRVAHLQVSFSHPMEMIGMDMEKPKSFTLHRSGETENLLEKLGVAKVMDRSAWKIDYRVKRPGAYIFSMEPEPYWEPAEDCYIIHYTKTIVAAFGDDEGWDAELGTKTEIVPLSRPFGLYAGNLFQGIVKLNGKPVPYTEVEVEYYNKEQKAKAPTDYMVTQTIKADGNGVFSYAAPCAGWWGFAALNTADYKLDHNGKQKDVELGAVIWVEFLDWKRVGR